MKNISIADFADMPTQGKIQLVEALWDSIIEAPDQVDMPEWHKKELKRRLASTEGDAASGRSWPEVKQRIEKK